MIKDDIKVEFFIYFSFLGVVDVVFDKVELKNS